MQRLDREIAAGPSFSYSLYVKILGPFRLTALHQMALVSLKLNHMTTAFESASFDFTHILN